MTCAPVLHFAIGFDISSEMMAPVKPTTSEKIARPPRFSDLPPTLKLIPNTADSTVRNTISTIMIARFVRTNSAMRFIVSPERRDSSDGRKSIQSAVAISIRVCPQAYIACSLTFTLS